MNLYEIADVYQIALQSSVDPETGEISEQALARLDEIGTDLQDKAKNVAAHIGNIEAEAAAIREAEKRMAERRKSLEKQAERMREYLRTNMARTGISEVSCPWFVLGIKRCPPSVEVIDENELPDKYMRVSKEPDKIAIARDLKNGVEVPGAKLVTDKMRLEIR